MATSAFIKFIIGCFVFCLVCCFMCYLREWLISLVDYADKQAQKKYKKEAVKRAELERIENERVLTEFMS